MLTKTKKVKTINPLKLEDVEGLGPASISLINDEGIEDTIGLSCMNSTWLKNVTGRERAVTKKIMKTIVNTLVEKGIIPETDTSATEELAYRKTIPRLAFGCKAVDDLMYGGVESECVTQFFGIRGSGKTQTVHTLVVQAQIPLKDGGLAEDGEKASVLYFETEGTCRPERLVQIAIARKYATDEEDATKKFLDNVIIRKCHSAEDLYDKLLESTSLIKEYNVKLIIIDSIAAPLRSQFAGRGEGYAKFIIINELVDLLKKMATNYRLPIVLINQVYHEPDQSFGDPDRPFGGNVLNHATPYIIHLKPKGKIKRVARIFKSPFQPNDDAEYQVTSRGIDDLEVKEKKKIE